MDSDHEGMFLLFHVTLTHNFQFRAVIVLSSDPEPVDETSLMDERVMLLSKHQSTHILHRKNNPAPIPFRERHRHELFQCGISTLDHPAALAMKVRDLAINIRNHTFPSGMKPQGMGFV